VCEREREREREERERGRERDVFQLGLQMQEFYNLSFISLLA
jgi:hypothetical protein